MWSFRGVRLVKRLWTLFNRILAFDSRLLRFAESFAVVKRAHLPVGQKKVRKRKRKKGLASADTHNDFARLDDALVLAHGGRGTAPTRTGPQHGRLGGRAQGVGY